MAKIIAFLFLLANLKKKKKQDWSFQSTAQDKIEKSDKIEQNWRIDKMEILKKIEKLDGQNGKNWKK